MVCAVRQARSHAPAHRDPWPRSYALPADAGAESGIVVTNHAEAGGVGRRDLLGAEARGRIQNIAGDSAVVIPAETIRYGMSKTALLAVSRGFAKEAAGGGVTVNSVIAGPTHTGGVEDSVHELVDPALPWPQAQREFMRRHRPQSLIQRLIEPEEIAHMVVHLSSDFASAATGGAVRVDGG